jgi:plastocyanin
LAPGSPVPAAAEVSLAGRAFQPADVTVPAGAAVRWLNDDSEGHTVTAVDGSFNSGVLTVGNEFTETFETPGSFAYFCAIHPEMRGTVTVTE